MKSDTKTSSLNDLPIKPKSQNIMRYNIYLFLLIFVGCGRDVNPLGLPEETIIGFHENPDSDSWMEIWEKYKDSDDEDKVFRNGVILGMAIDIPNPSSDVVSVLCENFLDSENLESLRSAAGGALMDISSRENFASDRNLVRRIGIALSENVDDFACITSVELLGCVKLRNKELLPIEHLRSVLGHLKLSDDVKARVALLLIYADDCSGREILNRMLKTQLSCADYKEQVSKWRAVQDVSVIPALGMRMPGRLWLLSGFAKHLGVKLADE